jgi:cytidylate kinase
LVFLDEVPYMRIAISGQSGCGNTTATTNVASQLNLTKVNYTFRDLSRDLNIPFEALHKEAEKNPIFDYLTDLTLIKHALIHENIVVGTRLAAWMMDADLRIWLHASLEARAHRVNKREQEKSSRYEEVLYTTLKRDQSNRTRYLKLYGLDIEDHNDFDMTINTERITAEQVSSLIVAAAKWAKVNQLERKNIHLQRIIKIISENLDIPEDHILSKEVPLDIIGLYEKNKHKKFFRL